jgi:HlyD family secretion protein
MLKFKKFIVTGSCGIILLIIVIWQAGLLSNNKISPGKISDTDNLIKGDEIVFTVKDSLIPITYKAVGTVQSRDSVDLAARIISRIVEVKVREGDKVTQGDILIKLDNTEYLVATAQAKEQVKSAEASLKAAREDIKRQQATLNYAKSENERMQQLYKAKIISKKQLDLALSNYNQALASWNHAIQSQNAARANLAVARQEQLKFETILAYATIKSPMDGVVNERLVDPGDLANPGKILLKIFDPNRLQLEVPIREGLVRKIKIGDKVPFDVGSLDKDFIGKIMETIPAVDPRSRTFLVKIAITDSGELVPGMFGTIYLPLGSKPALLIPKQSINEIGQIESVKVLNGKKYQRTFIRTVPYSKTRTMRQVISGLKSGQKIILPN